MKVVDFRYADFDSDLDLDWKMSLALGRIWMMSPAARVYDRFSNH
jgi:hypothetical protein